MHDVARKNNKRLRRNPNQDNDINNSPMFSKLSEDEKNLVLACKIDPETYFEIKAKMIQENQKNKAVKESFIEEA